MLLLLLQASSAPNGHYSRTQSGNQRKLDGRDSIAEVCGAAAGSADGVSSSQENSGFSFIAARRVQTSATLHVQYSQPSVVEGLNRGT